MRLAPSRRTLRLRALPLLFLAALAAVPFVLVALYQPIYVSFGWDDPVEECFHEAWWTSERQSRLEGPIQFFSPKRFAFENDAAGLSKSEPVVETAATTGGTPPGAACPEGDAAPAADVLYPDPCDTLPRRSVRFINFYLVAFIEYSSYSDVFAEPYHEAYELPGHLGLYTGWYAYGACGYQRQKRLRLGPIPMLAPCIYIAWAFLWPAVVYLSRRHHGRCLKCGYDIRSLPQPRCPECGTDFTSPRDTPP